MDVIVVFHTRAVLLYLTFLSVLDNVAVALIIQSIGNAKPLDILAFSTDV